MQSLALLLLRLSFGLGIAVHGYVPLFVAPESMEGMADLIAKYEWPAPAAWAYLAKVTEMVGGILIAVGLLTRACALACAFTMGVGFYMAHWPGPFMASENGYELAMLYGTVFLALVLMGGGKLSVDGLRTRSDHEAEQGGATALSPSSSNEWASPVPTPHGAGAVAPAAPPATGAPVTGAAAVWDGSDEPAAGSRSDS